MSEEGAGFANESKGMKNFGLAMAFAAVMPLMAETETVGGYTWTYRISGGMAEIVV